MARGSGDGGVADLVPLAEAGVDLAVRGADPRRQFFTRGARRSNTGRGVDRVAVRDPDVGAAEGEPGLHLVELVGPEHDAGDDRGAGADGDRAATLLDRPAADGGGGTTKDAALRENPYDAAGVEAPNGGSQRGDGS